MYKGHYKNNKKHGQGVFIWYIKIVKVREPGREYNGEWVAGKREGQGEFNW